MIPPEQQQVVRAALDRIQDLLQSGRREDAIAAVTLCDSLPLDAAQEFKDAIPFSLYEAAQKAEPHIESETCRRMYEKALSIPVKNAQIHAGCSFRLAMLCQGEGDVWRAIDYFHAAIRDGAGWEEMTNLARYRLASLLVAAEEFGEAESLLREIRGGPSNPYFTPTDAALLHARCMVMEGATGQAASLLEPLAANLDNPGSVEANRLLAEIKEASGDHSGAGRCYQAILESPFAETNLKAAVAYRKAALKR